MIESRRSSQRGLNPFSSRVRNGLTAADGKIGVFTFAAVLAIFLIAVKRYFMKKRL